MGCGMNGLSGQAVAIHVGMAVVIGPGLAMDRSMGDWSVQGARTRWKPAMPFHVQVSNLKLKSMTLINYKYLK